MLNKVLFIDDDSVALMLNRKLVEKALFAKETVTALNGKLAMDYYLTLLEQPQQENCCPQIVFLDLNMPVMDGWDFMEEFSRSIFPHFNQTKMVVLSSSINPADLERTRKYPMVIEFIAKPVTIEILQRLEKELNKTQI